MDLNPLKAELRRAALARRAAACISEDQGAAQARLRALVAEHPGAVVAAYAAMRGEPDPLPGLAAHLGALCLPVVVARARPLIFRAHVVGGPLIPGTFGAQVPPEGAAELIPDLVIVPLLAFDVRGGRLGYGGGFYDRTLAQLRARGRVIAVGYAFDGQECPAVPLEATDEPLDLIVTPTRCLRLRHP